jgi:hypothetical protein
MGDLAARIETMGTMLATLHRRLTEQEQAKINVWALEGWGTWRIANELPGRKQSTIDSFLKRQKKKARGEIRATLGRPSFRADRADLHQGITEDLLEHPFSTLREAQAEAMEAGISLSVMELRRGRNENHFHYRRTRATVPLTEKHKADRVAMCSEILDNEEKYKYLIISDESMVVQDNRTALGAWIDPHNPHPAIFYPRAAHPMQVMVWGAIGPNGLKLPLLRCPESLTGESYCEMLAAKDGPIDILDEFFGRGEYCFQQDNATPHEKKTMMTFLKEVRGLNLLAWAPKSPDLSQVEHMWPILKRAIRGRRFANQD